MLNYQIRKLSIPYRPSIPSPSPPDAQDRMSEDMNEIEILQRAVREAEEEYGTHEATGWMVYKLGYVLHKNRRNREAKAALERCLRIAASIGEEHPLLVEAYHALGKVRKTLGGNPLPLLRRAVALAERQCVPQGTLVRVYRTLGSALAYRGEETEGEKILVHALSVAEREGAGHDWISVSTCLLHLGRLFLTKKRLPEAEQHLSRAVMILRKESGMTLKTASALHYLGIAYAKQNLHAEAEDALCISLDIQEAEERRGKHSRLCADTMVFLAGIYESRGDMERARDLLGRTVQRSGRQRTHESDNRGTPREELQSVSSKRVHVCHYCHKSTVNVLRCSRCHQIYYCSQECQRFDWYDGGHRAQCRPVP